MFKARKVCYIGHFQIVSVLPLHFMFLILLKAFFLIGRSSTLSSGTVETSINLKNLFGFADLLTLTLEKGLSQSNVYSISGSVPKFLDSPYRVECKIHQIFQDRQKWSSYVERFRGGSISLSKGQSAIVYECGWRRISDPSRRASNEILSSLGDTIKSSLSLSHAMHDLIRNPRLGKNDFVPLVCIQS